jgi:hypothetical protein
MYILTGTWPNIKGASIIKPKPTVGSQSRATTRRILREVWRYESTAHSSKMGNNFRAVMNAGDLLGRKNYSCGGPNMIGGSRPGMMILTSKDGGQSNRNCDNSGIQPSTCNVKYVYDSSNVTRYRKERAINRGYNSNNSGYTYSYGGSNNGSQSVIRRVRS